MSPEIFKKHQYTKAGDVYAFALILYEIMTNNSLYEGFGDYQIMKFVDEVQNKDTHLTKLLNFSKHVQISSLIQLIELNLINILNLLMKVFHQKNQRMKRKNH